MTIQRPFRRTFRQFADGGYAKDGRWQMVMHPQYAQDADKFIRGFLVIQEDFQKLFQYIEPDDINEASYSFRTHELLMRACIEIEANFKAILSDNLYAPPSGHLNIRDYEKVEKSHFLSDYRVKVPYWTGANSVRQPFACWKQQQTPLPWYQAYNRAKHDRHNNFKDASFGCLVDAVCGLSALLASQFLDYDFSPAGVGLSISMGIADTFNPSIGGFFRVAYPQNIPQADRYDFNWQAVKGQADPFANFVY